MSLIDPSRIPINEDEQDAFDKLKQAWDDERIDLHCDYNHLNRANSPVYDVWENALPLVIISVLGLGLLFTSGLAASSGALLVSSIGYVFVIRPWLAIRLKKRVIDLAFSSPGGWKLIWSIGGIAINLKVRPSLGVKAPKGNWELFARAGIPEKYRPMFDGTPEHQKEDEKADTTDIITNMAKKEKALLEKSARDKASIKNHFPDRIRSDLPPYMEKMMADNEALNTDKNEQPIIGRETPDNKLQPGVPDDPISQTEPAEDPAEENSDQKPFFNS